MSTQIGQSPIAPGATSSVFNPDQLICGVFQPVTRDVKVSGGAYKRGTILGKVKATGVYTLCVKSVTDGSQVPAAILVDDRDGTIAPVDAPVYLLGEFNSNAIIFDPSWTLAELIPAMDAQKIFLRNPVKAPAID